MVKMTATKMLTYANRRLVPGEDFEAKTHRDMKVLLATRKAKVKREEVEVPPPPPEVAQRIAEVTAPDLQPADVPPSVAASGNESDGAGDIVALRAEYERVLGKRPFYGWDAATLRDKMAAAGT